MADYKSIAAELRQAYKNGVTASYEWRRDQLLAISRLLDENRTRIAEAMKKDLCKPSFASQVDEIDFSINEAHYAINNLEEWMKPEQTEKDLINIMEGVYIKREPVGVVLALGAWNYPIQLVFTPLVAIIAAGNCCVVKPSELSEFTSLLCEELIPQYMDKRCVRVFHGGVSVATGLLQQQWDHIMYTGSSRIAKIVMKAAAEHLTPVTLELGGKCPVFIDEGSDLATVANRIVWGKYKNAGQTCVAPDYALCSPGMEGPVVEHLKKAILDFYGENPKKSPDYERLQNDRHYARTKALLKSSGGTVVHGGETDDKERYISPTIVTGVREDSDMVSEEIFGPILYTVTVRDYNEAIDYINKGDKPLAIYAFTKRPVVREAFMDRTSSGSLTVNEVLIAAGEKGLPFGGVGMSGMGSYHGKHGFINFSHGKACLFKKQNMEGIKKALIYPPYSVKKYNRLSKLTSVPVKGPLRKALPRMLYLAVLAAVFAFFVTYVKPLFS